MDTYEKKYKEALERARKINSGEGVEAPSGWTVCEVIFPELRECEDEKIIKAIIAHIKDMHYYDTYYDVTPDEMIAWLEKQIEQKPIMNVQSKFHEGDWIIHHGTNTIYQVVAIIDNQYQLKYGDTYIIQYCVDVDKCAKLFKPKFNADDWVVNNTTHNVCRILKVEHGQYICDNCSFPITKENEYHLWTIKDAKDRMATRLSQTKLQDEQQDSTEEISGNLRGISPNSKWTEEDER